MSLNGYLHEIVGKVEKIISSNEAEVSFKWNNTQKIGTLAKDKLQIGCRPVNAKFISDCVHVGSKIKFVCTSPGAATPGGTPLCILRAWRMEEGDIGYPTFGFPNIVRPGLTNAYVTVNEISKKLAILIYKNEEGKEESVLMLASKLYIGKKRVNGSLLQVMTESDYFFCDAVPVIPSTNDQHCSWFAVCVWRGKKPAYYDEKKKAVTFSEITQELAHYPYSLFLFAEGLIMCLLNHENGLLLGEVAPKVFQTVLFSSSICYMGDTNFANTDLRDIFKERDRVRFIAVRAPGNRMVAQWVATYVAPLDPADNADFLVHGMKVQ
nr:PREDICTED: uncharacterized protein LOC109035416 [Bemisia tabaci]